jgi:hypothetical protein
MMAPDTSYLWCWWRCGYGGEWKSQDSQLLNSAGHVARDVPHRYLQKEIPLNSSIEDKKLTCLDYDAFLNIK